MKLHESQSLIELADRAAKFCVKTTRKNRLGPSKDGYVEYFELSELVEDLVVSISACAYGMAFTSDTYGIEDLTPQLVYRYLFSSQKEVRKLKDMFPDFPLQEVLDRLWNIEQEFRHSYEKN